MEYRKLVWVFVVAFLFGGYQSEGCWEIEKAALFQLKPFFPLVNGEGISWGKGNCCRWNRVECSTSTGRATQLFLEDSYDKDNKDIYQGWYLNISLFLPFEELKSLNLGGNYIAGFIDNQDLNVLSHLKTLNISYDGMNDSVPSQDNKRELKLMSLEELNLWGNVFNSYMLSSLGSLSNLKSLSLTHIFDVDAMEGSIGLPALKNLEKLHLEYGNENGWQNLTNLKELTLTDLSSTSNIIRDIGTLTSLEDLVIDGCDVGANLNLYGFCELRKQQTLAIINSDWNVSLPECFSELTSLKYLDISKNHFSGNISVFKNLTLFEYLDISFNNFFGDISMLKNLTLLEYLDLSSNKFSGYISFFMSLTSLRELRLSKNKIEILSSLAPLFNLSKLQKLYADNNMIYNAETEMHSLDTPTFQLRSITLSCCGDGGSFPQSLNHQHDLEHVDLSNINFKGYQFPNWLLENNKKLRELHLANIALYRDIFSYHRLLIGVYYIWMFPIIPSMATSQMKSEQNYHH